MTEVDPMKAAKLERIERATAIVRKMLPDKKRRRPVTVAALGRALAVTAPASDHGQILALALKTCAANQPPADDAQMAILWCAAKGETPTQAAINSRVQRLQHRVPPCIDRQEVSRIADEIGDQVSAWVAAYVFENGTGPRWTEVRSNFGWSRVLGGAVIQQLIRQGKLVATREARSLHPAKRPVTIHTGGGST